MVLFFAVGQVHYPKTDTTSFDDDSSDALSPEQPGSQESQSSAPSPVEPKVNELSSSSSSPVPNAVIQVSTPSSSWGMKQKGWMCRPQCDNRESLFLTYLYSHLV